MAEARLHERRGEYQEALNGFLKALAQIEPMGDTIWEASSVTGVATVYSQMGEEVERSDTGSVHLVFSRRLV